MIDPIAHLADGPPYLSRLDWQIERACNLVALQVDIAALGAKAEIRFMVLFARRSMGQRVRYQKMSGGME